MRLGLSFVLLVLTSVLMWIGRHNNLPDASELPDSIAFALPYLLGCAFWLSLAWTASQSLALLIRMRARRRGTEHQLPKLLIDLVSLLIFFLALLAIVSQVFDKSLTGLLATSGALAAVIGFAIQKTIGDVMAGITLNIGRAGLRLGDWIQLPGAPIGRVTMIGWHTTQLVTIEGKTVVVPNGTLTGGQIINFNLPDRHFRVQRTLTLGFALPPARAIAVLNSAMVATPGVLSEPAPEVFIDDCTTSGVVYALAFWVADYPESLSIGRDVLANAIMFLDQIGWAPAVPQHEISVTRSRPVGLQRSLQVAAILRRVGLFEPFRDEAFDLLERCAEIRELPAGGIAAREGDPGQSLFVIVSGVLDVQKRTPQGKVTVARLTPGGVFGEMSLLTGAARSATVLAATPALLLEIGRDSLHTIFEWHPETLDELTRLQAERLAANESALNLSRVEKEQVASIGLTEFLRRKITEFFMSSAPSITASNAGSGMASLATASVGGGRHASNTA